MYGKEKAFQKVYIDDHRSFFPLPLICKVPEQFFMLLSFHVSYAPEFTFIPVFQARQKGGELGHTETPWEFATEWDLLAEEASLLHDVTTYAVGTAVPVRPND